MDPWTSAEIEPTQADELATLWDACIILRAANNYVPDAEETPCRMRNAGSRPIFLSNGRTAGAIFRFGPDVTLATNDRLQLTKRMTQPITPVTYAVDGQAEREQFTIIVPVRRWQS